MSAAAPAISEPSAGERSVLPVVARPRKGLSGIAIGIGAVILGLILFSVLEARRQSSLAPAVDAQAPMARLPGAPPPLDIPPSPYDNYAVVLEPAAPVPAASMPPPPQPSPPLPPPPQVVVRQSYPEPPFQAQAPATAPRTSGGSALVLDNSSASGSGEQASSNNVGVMGNTSRVRAAMIANRSTTVPQGTLIRAVLETALDSTSPGFARAIISRDVMGFDGTRVLIPRGSRLIGEYAADASPGQQRALINWTRLIRPDGATIAIGSPAADTLGRGGIKAEVDGHFWERFSSAILQSALDIGVNLASRKAGGTVIYSLPGSQVNGVGQATQSRQIVPTLKVKPGTSLSVFVARDLDFSAVEGGR